MIANMSRARRPQNRPTLECRIYFLILVAATTFLLLFLFHPVFVESESSARRNRWKFLGNGRRFHQHNADTLQFKLLAEYQTYSFVHTACTCDVHVHVGCPRSSLNAILFSIFQGERVNGEAAFASLYFRRLISHLRENRKLRDRGYN